MGIINTGNNSDGKKISFLELVFNVISFFILAFFDNEDFQWWFFIIGVVISIFLSWFFDEEKYNLGAYILAFIVVFLVFVTIWDLYLGLPIWTWLIIWPILYSIMVKIISKSKAKETTCGNCMEEYAMEVYYTELVDSENISITKSQWITDIYGEKHENRYEVPGKRDYYIGHRRCKYCGYEDSIYYSFEHEN